MTHGASQVHFLQIWSLPHTPRLSPTYYTRNFSDEEKINKFATIVAPVGLPGVNKVRKAKGPVPIHSQLTMYASLLEKEKNLDTPLAGKRAYTSL